jgi:trimethylamine:corrinoid methyltransferase-like protein
VGIGGNYLQETETAESFRDFLNLSPFFAVEPWGNTMGIDDARRMETLAHEKARRLLANDVPSPLDDDQIKEVDKIVASAKQALQRKGKI